MAHIQNGVEKFASFSRSYLTTDHFLHLINNSVATSASRGGDVIHHHHQNNDVIGEAIDRDRIVLHW